MNGDMNPQAHWGLCRANRFLTVPGNSRTNECYPTTRKCFYINQTHLLKGLELFKLRTFFTVKGYINNNTLLLLACNHR